MTYHGPGQLVVYPIVDLERLGIRIHEWIRLLEQAIIDTLADLGVVAGRDPGATGVWVGRGAEDTDGRGGRKIAAIGVRVSRWVTMHGLALNVDPDLGHFDLIVPCGLAGRPVTSIARERDGDTPSSGWVKPRRRPQVTPWPVSLSAGQSSAHGRGTLSAGQAGRGTPEQLQLLGSARGATVPASGASREHLAAGQSGGWLELTLWS